MGKLNPTLPPFTQQDVDRFWNHVKVTEPDQCWEWQMQRDIGGYGHFQVKSARHRNLKTHRVAHMLTRGITYEPLQVLHRCDNRACCNPAHLFTGTQKDNMEDMCAKGRQATGDRNISRKRPDLLRRGAAHGMSKLNDGLVREIRQRYVKGGAQGCKPLAREYGVTENTIRSIIKGLTWRHVA